VTQQGHRSHRCQGACVACAWADRHHKAPHGTSEYTMSSAKRCAKKHTKARGRRRLTAQERLARDRRQAQHAAEALQQALDDLGLPEDLVTEIEKRLRSQKKLSGKTVGVMCPPLFGCRTNAELCRVRGVANSPARHPCPRVAPRGWSYPVSSCDTCPAPAVAALLQPVHRPVRACAGPVPCEMCSPRNRLPRYWVKNVVGVLYSPCFAVRL
jgi:hypothetical protein